ncbi:hypothetical protein ACJZ2D_000954 [Fusarium nematophilum]
MSSRWCYIAENISTVSLGRASFVGQPTRLAPQRMAAATNFRSSVPPNEGDISSPPAFAWLPAMLLPLLMMVVLAILLGSGLRKLITHFWPIDSEEPAGSESSGSSAGNRDAPQLDLVAPPASCKKMREQLATRGILPSWATLSSLAVCAICLETIKDDDLVRHLPCEHNFHSNCIAQWFMRRHDTCPICAIHFMPPQLAHCRSARQQA